MLASIIHYNTCQHSMLFISRCLIWYCRIYTNSRDTQVLQYSTVTFTAGAAIITVQRWLAELR